MVFGGNVSAKSGDRGSSIIGDGNSIVNINFGPKTPKILSRSLISNICKTIGDMEIDYENEYSIQQNSDWMEKFEYNGVNLYIDVFDNYSDGYDEVSKILQGHLKRTTMIMKIRTIYLKIEHSKPDEEDGDYIISRIFDILKEEVCCQELINPVGLIDEDVDAAIYLIMFYVFTKCKILKIVPKDG
ncbi:hypothetical protein [Enterococcus hirae]|uniref:hypothetical protein n=1 Tax=Enterococcus hirae TaxID=1354 RepID=UPI0039A625A9